MQAIADRSNHVLTVIPTLEGLIASEGRFEPKRIGIGEASTFPGFCNTHDATFAPIEGETLVLDARTAFLFAYRSVCLEAFRKGNELFAAQAMEKEAHSADEPRKSYMLGLTKTYREGVERGLVAAQALHGRRALLI